MHSWAEAECSEGLPLHWGWAWQGLALGLKASIVRLCPCIMGRNSEDALLGWSQVLWGFALASRTSMVRPHPWIKGEHSETLPLHQQLAKCCWGMAKGHVHQLVYYKSLLGGLWAFLHKSWSLDNTFNLHAVSVQHQLHIYINFAATVTTPLLPTFFAHPNGPLLWLLLSFCCCCCCLTLPVSSYTLCLVWQSTISCPPCALATVLTPLSLYGFHCLALALWLSGSLSIRWVFYLCPYSSQPIWPYFILLFWPFFALLSPFLWVSVSPTARYVVHFIPTSFLMAASILFPFFAHFSFIYFPFWPHLSSLAFPWVRYVFYCFEFHSHNSFDIFAIHFALF